LLFAVTPFALFMNPGKQRHSPQKATKVHQKRIRRKRKLKRLRQLYHQQRLHARQTSREISPTLTTFHAFTESLRNTEIPPHSITIEHIAYRRDTFTAHSKISSYEGYFEVPTIFSLAENSEESFTFLKRLFTVLYERRSIEVVIDYKRCERIELDASVVLDILLLEFIRNIRICRKTGHRTTASVTPINFDRPEIIEILLSIGSYRNLKGIYKDFPDIISFPLRIGGKSTTRNVELDTTDVVKYIEQCLKSCQRTLTSRAKKELSDIIGEVLNNAEVHSSTSQHYLIGYFKQNQQQASLIEDAGTLGTFNLVILNFGQTIYQKFKSPDCRNVEVVQQMTSLSKEYTDRGWLGQLMNGPRFEEESLWTLYAL